jgi:trimeric autotransporter adhesin
MRLLPVLLTLAVSFTASAQTYTISTFAGGALPVNIPGTSASLSTRPQYVAADASGNLFFVDQNTVMRLDAATGILTRVAGNGSTGFSGDNGPATSAQLYFPTGVAVDSAGNLYIADTANLRIRKVSNGVIATVAGSGVGGYSGDNGPAASARLDDPQGVAVDSAGNLYIADTDNNCIRKVANGVITTVAGNGLQGFSGDNGPAASAQLNSPYGVAVDSAGNLYIADTQNQRIRKVANGAIATIAGTGTQGFSGDNGPAINAQLNLPNGVAVDSAGNLYIADGASRIRKVAGGVIATVSGDGLVGFSGDGGPATSAELSGPDGVAVDSAANLYIADSNNDRIRKVANGVITTVAGGGTPVGGNGPATGVQFGYPAAVALDSSGSLYIADEQSVIWKISNGVIAAVAGNGTQGFSGDGGPATAAQLSLPQSVAVDSAGNVYIADTYNNRIRKVANGVISTVAGNGTPGFSGDNGPATGAELNLPVGVAVDSSGNLYISDSYNNRIREVANGMIATVAGNGGSGFTGYNGPATSVPLDSPTGIAVDYAGNLYISVGFYESAVLKVSSGVVSVVAGNGSTGFSGDNGPATSAQLWEPGGVAVDSAGNVYICDGTNQRIRKVSNGVITTIAGNGAEGFSGDNGPAFNAQLNEPGGVGVDSSGNVYVADGGNDRIRLLTPAGSPAITGNGIVNAADPATHGVQVVPGSIASAYGNYLVNSLTMASGSPLPLSLGGVSLQFGNGLSAPLFAVAANQVNFQVPWELAGQSEAPISALVDGQVSVTQTMILTPVLPGIFSINGQGTGQGAILDTSYRLVDPSNPATAGATLIQIYCTGLGAVTNQPPSGSPPLSDQLSETTATPMVTIGGAQAQVLFSGLAPGTVGEYQVDALVPAGSAKGAAVPVVIAFGPSETANGVFIGGATSNTVTIAVQ